MGELPIWNQTDRGTSSAPPSVRAHIEPMMTLPATVYRPPVTYETSWLESPSASPRPSQSSGSRSPRFHEHLADLEDPRPASSLRNGVASPAMVESPTLGRYMPSAPPASLAKNVRQTQHLASSVSYAKNLYGSDGRHGKGSPKTPPSARTWETVSPSLRSEPRDGYLAPARSNSNDSVGRRK